MSAPERMLVGDRVALRSTDGSDPVRPLLERIAIARGARYVVPGAAAGSDPARLPCPNPSRRRHRPGREGQDVPHHAGPLPDERRPGPGHLRRQGQEPAGPGRVVLPQDRGRGPADLRLDRRGGRHRLPGRRQRGRCPADGSPADQGHPAQVQPRPQGRQDLSLPADHDGRGLSRGSTSRASRETPGSSSTGRSRGPRACAGRSRCSSGSSSSAPARWTSRRTTRAGGGSGPACWRRSISARPRATCGSTARPTDATSAGSASSWTARRTSSSRRWRRR